jgi:hypothetical protein
MLLLAGSILVASASIYEGHNVSGLLALIFALVVSEVVNRLSISSEVAPVLEVIGSILVLSTHPDKLSVLSGALTLGCL